MFIGKALESPEKAPVVLLPSKTNGNFVTFFSCALIKYRSALPSDSIVLLFSPTSQFYIRDILI